MFPREKPRLLIDFFLFFFFFDIGNLFLLMTKYCNKTVLNEEIRQGHFARGNRALTYKMSGIFCFCLTFFVKTAE